MVLFAATAHSHHSFVMFDETKVIEVTGVVKEFQYANPHAWLILDVLNSDGTVTVWGLEAGPGPSGLARVGIRKSDFAPGAKVTVTAHPMKNGKPAGSLLTVTRLSDGKVFKVVIPRDNN
jgi:hypothetical protein